MTQTKISEKVQSLLNELVNELPQTDGEPTSSIRAYLPLGKNMWIFKLEQIGAIVEPPKSL